MWERNEKNKLQKVGPESNICRYDTSVKHELCKHQHYCIFNRKRRELESRITVLENDIEDLENLNNNLLNDDILYHTRFKEYYENQDYGGLKNRVKSLIRIEREELIGLVRFKGRVLDGKVNGYGYGD